MTEAAIYSHAIAQPASRPSLSARTKIVATVGPACSSPEQLAALVAAGVDIFRLNMAHGQLDEHTETVRAIRQLSDRTRPLAILVDLAGPKIRLGQLVQDPLLCRRDVELEFVRGETAQGPLQLVSNYDRLVDELDIGDPVMLADGTVRLMVTQKTADSVKCRVLNAGDVRSRQGINLPGAKLSVPALTDHDRKCARWAAEQRADLISLSFVRSPRDVDSLRQLLKQHGSQATVIAKIEKQEALQELEQIVRAADGIMVARGDLGVEVDVAHIPLFQKQIIRVCNQWQRPVIVATQMLDSMQRLPRPTRAEVTDVANAILDGADACMLSGETAIGLYPVESVETMTRILLAIEPSLVRAASPSAPPSDDPNSALTHPVTQSVVFGAGRISDHLKAKLVVMVTRTGATALIASNYRSQIPTLGVSDDEATLRRMCLYWGITPLRGAPCADVRKLLAHIDQWGRQQQILKPRDWVVLVTGSGLEPGAHNVLFVHEVPGTKS